MAAVSARADRYCIQPISNEETPPLGCYLPFKTSHYLGTIWEIWRFAYLRHYENFLRFDRPVCRDQVKSMGRTIRNLLALKTCADEAHSLDSGEHTLRLQLAP